MLSKWTRCVPPKNFLSQDNFKNVMNKLNVVLHLSSVWCVLNHCKSFITSFNFVRFFMIILSSYCFHFSLLITCGLSVPSSIFWIFIPNTTTISFNFIKMNCFFFYFFSQRFFFFAKTLFEIVFSGYCENKFVYLLACPS